MLKSMALQQELGPLFDITFDCEDGAAIAAASRSTRNWWRASSTTKATGSTASACASTNSPVPTLPLTSLSLLAAGQRLAYIVLPKADSVDDVARAIELINKHASKAGRATPLPVHVLIETHGALRDAHAIRGAACRSNACRSGSWILCRRITARCLTNAMRTPGQFTHPLIVRAKLEMVAACHAHGKIPSHNVTTEIKDTAVVANDAAPRPNSASRGCGVSTPIRSNRLLKLLHHACQK
ncbi:aldolase/citrate lyase family protein [Massilia sp. B-10]|nr:aldolase/citrate lyase family protein [Massilia sp. B-10]